MTRTERDNALRELDDIAEAFGAVVDRCERTGRITRADVGRIVRLFWLAESRRIALDRHLGIVRPTPPEPWTVN